MVKFTVAEAQQILAVEMPGCVRDLDPRVDAVGAGKATLAMPFSERACREGGVLSGQALAVLADTAMCFAIWSDGRGTRSVATIDLHVTYLKGAHGDEVVARAEVVRSGRLLAFTRVSMSVMPSGQEIATAVGTFALPT